MKKTLSVILSLAVLLCAVVVIPAFSVSADTNDISAYTSDNTLFDSSVYEANGHKNAKGELWLSSVNSTTTRVSGAGTTIVMPSGVVTSNILEHNNGVKTNLTNFEWQFNVISGNDLSAQTASLSFCFHVNDNSTIDKNTRLKTLSVTLFGSNYNGNYQQPQSLVVEYTMAQKDKEGNVTGYVTRPYDYASSKPKENSYIDLSGTNFVNSNGTTKNHFRDLTINIKLEGRNLTLSVWKKGDESTKKTLNVTLHGGVQFETTPYGDFAIVNSGSCNMLFNGMTIKCDHVYDNACDAECNECKATRVPSEHVYDNACDTTCNVCKAIREVSGHNYQVDAEASIAATYFVAGKEVKVCEYCGDKVETPLPATDKALDSVSETFADGKLTIKWTYSDELAIDITKGAVITFNYAIGEHKGSVQVNGTQSGEVILEGFNADRLNSDLTYSLTAVYGENDTTKLKSATEKTVQAANVSTDTKLNTLLEALKNENTEVSGTMIDTNDFVSNTIEADIKAGTMEIRFVASPELITELAKNNTLARVNKLYVTIDGLETKEFSLEKLTKVTIVNISGLSFEQLYGKVTVKIGFEYAADTTKNFDTNEVVFDAASVIAAADTDAANALEAYMTK